jgi:hypothetical protein
MHVSLGDNTYFHTQVPEVILEPVRHEVFNTSSWEGREYQHCLAGNIKEEFSLIDCYDDVKFYVEEQARLYKGTQYELVSLWVNFMEKHEFNPPHSHGGDLSFVMFIQVPYNIEDEFQVFKNGAAPCAGMFHFMYCNIFGHICSEQIPVDKSYEGSMFMFPSLLKHGVFPFYTSDKHRITIAGNLIEKNT